MLRNIVRSFVALSACALVHHAVAEEQRPSSTIAIKIVGGLANVSQYKKVEEPFWLSEMPARTGNRASFTIRPFDQSGLRGSDMLQLMQMGVVPFGTALLVLAAGDEPELNALDLPALTPDIGALREVVGLLRPHTEALLRQRYGVELLGIYAYPAQAIYCAAPFSALSDLAGRRIRTSSVSQSEMVAALGAVPVITPFAETVNAVTKKVVDCAVTGTLSGNEIGLSEVTSHMHAMAIGWGISIFAANSNAWRALPDDLRRSIRDGVTELERRIWDRALDDTQQGILCNAGRPECTEGRRSRMTIVETSTADEATRRRVVIQAVLPRWIDRCGSACVTLWNQTLARSYGVTLNETADQTGAGPATTTVAPR